ncbi:hypothetical protein AB6A40_005711 [Gnathostoma spinigerum]|uniref:Uncharacterized protein n=1 Tax=Gnathostoma spinigerum TaxID=75299 RepID=A0ABD6EIF6_9BILA
MEAVEFERIPTHLLIEGRSEYPIRIDDPNFLHSDLTSFAYGHNRFKTVPGWYTKPAHIRSTTALNRQCSSSVRMLSHRPSPALVSWPSHILLHKDERIVAILESSYPERRDVIPSYQVKQTSLNMFELDGINMYFDPSKGIAVLLK